METWTIFEAPLASVPELRYIGRMSAPNVGGSALPPHHHEWAEITYVHRGTVRWWVEDEWTDLHGGEAYVTLPGELHGGTLKSLASCTLYWLQLPLTLSVRAEYLGLPATEAAELQASVARLPRQFAVPDLSRIFDRLLGHLADRDSLGATRVRADLLSLLLTFIDAARVPSGAVSGLTHEALAVMRENLAHRLDVPSLAAKLGCSVSYVKQRFRRDVGMGPAEYHLRLRIEEAKERLRRTSDPILSIAIGLGFSSSQNFATAFRRVTGTPPSAFRRLPNGPIAVQ